MKNSSTRSIFEVAFVFILIRLVVWEWNITSASRWTINLLGWNYFGHIIYVLIPLLILLLTRRNFKSYGLALGLNWKTNLKWGAIFAATLGMPSLFALILGWLKIEVPVYWLSTLVFQVFFAGFGEEILYRGYYQSRINDGFGRPFTASGMRFGVGLIAISILFGFAHVLNPFNPLQGSYGLDWMAGVVALQTGIFYGFVREKTGSILTSAIIHGSTFWWDFIGDGSTRFLAMSIGWCISWIVLFAAFSKTKD
jgi:membrane protease YdiL (CAAX protease family)